MPVPLARAAAAAGELASRLVRRPPLLARGQLYFFLWNAAPDSGKAVRELGWESTPLEDGLQATLAGMELA
jgi:nucleoside-diphosphate-sugar epimerase